MAIYVGNNKLNSFLGNLPKWVARIVGKFIYSKDELILKDANGVYLLLKEGND